MYLCTFKALHMGVSGFPKSWLLPRCVGITIPVYILQHQGEEHQGLQVQELQDDLQQVHAGGGQAGAAGRLGPQVTNDDGWLCVTWRLFYGHAQFLPRSQMSSLRARMTWAMQKENDAIETSKRHTIFPPPPWQRF